MKLEDIFKELVEGKKIFISKKCEDFIRELEIPRYETHFEIALKYAMEPIRKTLMDKLHDDVHTLRTQHQLEYIGVDYGKTEKI